jgi:CRP-like cAMP-binding protein
LFQLRARHSHYLIARRREQVAAGIGFMVDEAEKSVRVFELISLSDEPIRFLLDALLRKCQTELDVEFIEIDASAYAPRMQRTLLELGFLPVSYIPANVFHEVERLDAIKMAKVLVPFDVGELQFCDAARPIGESVIKSFSDREVLPRIAAASRQTPLFIGLSDEQRQRLLGICAPRSFEPCEHLFRQGETDGTMHLILVGEVELVTRGPHHIANLATGQCVGETSLLYSPNATPPHSVSAIAKTSVETAAFPSREFSALIRRRPDIGVVLFRNLAADISTKLKLAAEPPP